MNATVYLFGGQSGNSGDKHFQFPDDYTATIFQTYANLTVSETLMAVSFDKSLTYHIYCKRTSNGYFGFAALLNGCWIGVVSKLIAVFEEAYSDVVYSDELLTINDKGAVQTNGLAIKTDEHEVERVCERLRNAVNGLSQYVSNLPVIDVSSNPRLIFKLGDNAADKGWRDHAGKYRSMYSLYGETKNGLNHVIERLQTTISEREKYREECVSLKNKIEKINKKKKQYEWVIILAAVLVVGAVVAIAIISDKNIRIKSQIETIQDNESTIERQKRKIAFRDSTISAKKQEIARLNTRMSEVEGQKNALQSKVDDIAVKCPIVISQIEIANVYYDGKDVTHYGETIYSSASRYLKPKIRYSGLTSGSIELKVKWYNSDGSMHNGSSSPSDCCFKQNVWVYQYDNESIELMGWGGKDAGHWKSGTYRIEIWYKTMCLGSRTVRIY